MQGESVGSIIKHIINSGLVGRLNIIRKVKEVSKKGESNGAFPRQTPDQRIFKMVLLTKEKRKEIPAMYSQDGLGGDAIACLKMFTPDSSWTWYVIEGESVLDEDDKVIDFCFFGMVDGFEKELGYFLLSELEKIKGPLGLPIERDLYWKPTKLKDIFPELYRD